MSSKLPTIARRYDDEHDNVPRQDSPMRGDRPCVDGHNLSHGRTAQTRWRGGVHSLSLEVKGELTWRGCGV